MTQQSREAPSNIEAEESYVGALLLDAGKLLDSMASLSPEDFYRPLNGQIFSVIRDIANRGENVDYVTVQNEMRNRGITVALTTLSSLQMDTPGAYGASRWAQIILEKSDARRTLYALSDATSGIYDGADPYETSARLSKDLALLGTPADHEPESLTLEEWIELSKVETSSPVIVPGIMHQGWRTIVVGGEGVAKALDVDTPLLTTDGWKTMGTVVVGDYVFSSNGHPVRVIAVTEPFVGNCYRMEFSDGSSMVADANHLWLTKTLYAREREADERRKVSSGVRRNDWRDQSWKRVHFPEIVSTAHIGETLMARGGHAVNHSIDVSAPIQFPERALPLDPYILGVWLGDGSSKESAITSMDREIVDYIVESGFSIKSFSTKSKASTYRFGRKLTERLRELNLIGSSYERLDTGRKHIPEMYKTASYPQRLSLVQGLMDTDGTVTNRGLGEGRGYGSANCSFTGTNRELVSDFLDLVIGLGIKATLSEGIAKLNGREISAVYRVKFQTDLPIFRLGRKLERLTPLRTSRSKLRYIKSCEPISPRTVRCIQVDSDDGMFVVGRTLIPTHNSTILRTISMAVAQGHHPFWFTSKIIPRRVLYIDLENPLEVLGEPHVENFINYIKINDPETYDPSRLKVWRRPGGINIRNQRDRADLQREIINHQPDLVCVGPLYKMYSGSSSERLDESAEEAMRVLDDLRTKYNFGLLMEHHAPKGQAGQKREMTPFGSSSWLRWPEVGVSLYTDKTDPRVVHVRRFRGDRLSSVSWPDQVVRNPHTIISGKWDGQAPELVRTSTR